MNKKIIGILVVTLLIATVLPATGSIEKNLYMTEKSEPLVFLDPGTSEEIQYSMVEADTEGNVDKSMVQSLDNLAPNPSFEEGDMLPTGWEHTDFEMGEAYHWDSDYAHTGEKSVGITNINEFYPNCKWHTTELIPVDMVNNLYEISGYCKYFETPNEDQYACIGIELYDENEESLRNTYLTCDYTYIPDEWIHIHTLFGWIEDQLKEKTKFVRIILMHRVSFESNPNPDLEIRFDDIYFGIKENVPPSTPSTPTGNTIGKPGEEYTYSTSATDPGGSNVWYMWSWGDEISSDWVGPFYSGDTVTASHIWNEKGDYAVKVKAKNFYGLESDWSDPLSVSMPKNKPYIFLPFFKFLESHPYLFPLLRQLLGN